MSLVLFAAVGYYLWTTHGTRPPLPPPVPAELTDPPARQVVERKRQAVLGDRRSGTAWGELGMAFDAHEAAAEAVTCYRQAMALDPNDPRWPYLLAAQMTRTGTEPDREEAVRLYRRAADCKPPTPAHRATALLALGDLLTDMGRGDEAAPLYQQVYAADPSNPWAAYRVGMLLAQHDETAKASRILLGLAHDPYTRKKSAIAMAELMRRAGKAQEADGYDYAAGLLSPDAYWPDPFAAEMGRLRRGRRALMNQYVIDEETHQDKAAVHTGNALADQYPSAETQVLLLRALVNAGDHAAAVAVADDVLRDPDGRKLVPAHLFLGLARMGLADRAEAEGRKTDADRLLAQAAEALAESARLKRDNAPAHLYRAKALLRLGRQSDAEEAARAGIASRPEEWEGYLTLADVLAARGRHAEAVAAAEQAVKLAHPNEPRPKQALESLKKKAAGRP